MYKKICLWIVMVFIPILGFAGSACHIFKNSTHQMAKAVLHITSDTIPQVQGVIYFQETAEGLNLYATITKAPPGVHGFHIHEFGDISNQGKAAGGHYNPNETKHGDLLKDSYEGAHAGDLGNIFINDEGVGTLKLHIPKMSLVGGKYPIAGRSIVLHANADKFTQPAGNAGARIAVGSIVLIDVTNYPETKEWF